LPKAAGVSWPTSQGSQSGTAADINKESGDKIRIVPHKIVIDKHIDPSATIYNLINNIILRIIQFDIFQAELDPSQKKIRVYFSTGNKGVGLSPGPSRQDGTHCINYKRSLGK
jgi:hypothetical protein